MADILAAGARRQFAASRAHPGEEGPSLLHKFSSRQRVFSSTGPRRPTRLGTRSCSFAPAHPARGRRHRSGHHQRIDCRTAPLPNVVMVTNVTAVDLITFPHHSRDPLAAYQPITCYGAYAFDRQERTVHRYVAANTVLATGGLGRIYRNTTNPPGARGDGLALAYRAARASSMQSTCSFIRRRWPRPAPKAF